MLPFMFLGEELLDRGKDHSTRSPGQTITEVHSAFSLFRWLAEKSLASRKCPEQLLVEIIAVGYNYQGGVFHGTMTDYPPGIECHCQAFT